MNIPIPSWEGKRVWVIGASSGIGAAVARSLLHEGAKVILSARRATQLDEVAAGHTQASVVAFDVTDTLAWPSAHRQAIDAFGSIDLVIFLAARYEPQRAWALDATSAARSFELNVLSVYRGLAEVIPYFQAQGHGGMALVASVSGYTGLPEATVYGATKAALINLAETLYFDLAPRGLSVYLVNPGFVATPMTATNDFAMPELISPEVAAQALLAGMKAGDFEIRFPRRFTALLRLVSRLPYRWRFPLLHKVTHL
ncbi:SDR family NAD(P)-dependent oxidoreductase [Chitinimonas naiadis]